MSQPPYQSDSFESSPPECAPHSESFRGAIPGPRFVIVACPNLEGVEFTRWLESFDENSDFVWVVVPEERSELPDATASRAPASMRFLRDGASVRAGDLWILPVGERVAWVDDRLRWQLPLRGPGTPTPSKQLFDSISADKRCSSLLTSLELTPAGAVLGHDSSERLVPFERLEKELALLMEHRRAGTPAEDSDSWLVVDSAGHVLSFAPTAECLVLAGSKGKRRVHHDLEGPLLAAISALQAGGVPVHVPPRSVSLGNRDAEVGFTLSALEQTGAASQESRGNHFRVRLNLPAACAATIGKDQPRALRSADTHYAEVPIGLAALDLQLRYLRINDRLAEMNGLPAADHIGKTIHEVLGDSASAIAEAVQPVLEKGLPVRDLETRGQTHADDTLRDWLVQYTPLHAEDDSVAGVNVVVQDITAQKEASRRLSAEHAITHLLADELSSRDLFPEILETLSQTLEVEVGEIWLYDEGSQVLSPNSFYSSSDDLAARSFQAAVPEEADERSGCPAQRAWFWKRAEVFRSLDLDTEFPRREFAAACGLQVAMAFPLLGDDLPYGSIALYAERPYVDTDALRDSLETIGRDIGRFIRRENIELALRASEEELRSITDSIPMKISFVDHDLRYRFTNEEYVRSFGLSKEELDGRLVREVVGEESFVEVEPMLRRALAGAQVEYEVDLPTKNGPASTLAVRYQPRTEEDGSISGVYALVVDVTQRANAERDANYRADCLEEIRRVNLELTGELDLARLERSVTEAAVKISGAEAGAFVHKITDDSRLRAAVYSTVADPQSRELKSSQAEYALRGPTRRSTVSVRIADLRKSPEFAGALRLFAFPIDTAPIRSYLAVPVLDRDGDLVGSIMLTHSKPGAFDRNAEDIIGGIALQVGIALENASLYETLRAREQSSRFQARQLEILDRRKDEFLAILGHELRNPLMALDVGMRVLRKNKADASELEWTHQMLERQTAQLTGLVDDLLDATRISRGKVRLRKKSVEMVEILESSVGTVEARARKKGQTIQLVAAAEESRVHGDPIRLEQVVTNLLTNAVKYSGEGTEIRITLEHLSKERIRIAVADQGVGLPPESLERIFEPFTQRDVSTEGLGIGLSLVRQLVALHGGRSYAESPGPDEGSTFSIELPLEAFAERETVTAPEGDHESALSTNDISVLLINKSGNASGETAEQLRQHGCRVVATGDEGLEAMVEDFRPQIVLIDVQSLDAESDLVAGRVRKLPACHGTRVIALRRAFATHDPERALDRVMFDETWTEPVPKESISGAIDHCISQRARSHATETLLLVEDNEDSARGMCLLLREEENRRVIVAGTVADALTAYEKYRPQVVLSDIGLPDGSGYDLASSLRGKGDSRLLMIAISGHAGEVDKRRSIEAGFDAHLPKPIDFQKLRELLDQRST